MTEIKESFSMQSFVSVVCVLEKVSVGDKVVGSATPLVYKLLDIVIREINRAATINKSFLDAETKAVFSKECKKGNKRTSNSCLGFRRMLDMTGDCPEKHVWEWLSFQRKYLDLVFFFVCLGRGGQETQRNMLVKLF